jgi:hypothetical protein
VSDTELDQPLSGSSPDECHLHLLSAISSSLSSIIPKGADFFGISHPTIQNLIQSSPGTRKLSIYKPQKFEVFYKSIKNLFSKSCSLNMQQFVLLIIHYFSIFKKSLKQFFKNSINHSI